MPPDLQGKVFSIRRLIAWFISPLAMLVAGPLSDKVLEPAMRNPQSSLALMLGDLIGTGPGRGMALLFIVGGGLACVIGLGGYTIRILREADTMLPDHDTLPSAPPAAPDERVRRMQDLLEARKQWITQPVTPERELALRSIASSLRKLGQEDIIAPET